MSAMPLSQDCARRTFDVEDQRRFAELSGDWNPVHMDAVAARRTLAGGPIVHGVHLLAWAIDAACTACAVERPITKVSANFSRFVKVDEEVTLDVVVTMDRLKLQISAADALRVEIALTLADEFDALPSPGFSSAIDRTPGREAGLPPEEVAGFSGFVASASSEAAWAAAFPAAAEAIGPSRLAALGATTRLVGMVCPGLNSLYTGLDVAFAATTGPLQLAFEVQAPRHGLIAIRVAGSGVHGRLLTLIRPSPARQPSSAALRGLLAPDALVGHHALVIGGSRGLGEVTAKLLATAGARVTLTYQLGEADAHAVAADIATANGDCAVMRYDVGLPAGDQLQGLTAPPTHVWYFATARIGDPGSRFFDRQRFDALFATHVAGFWRLATALQAQNPAVRLFYPSSTYVEERPSGLGEYAMAKAAAEILCEEINAALAPMICQVGRLPPLATDQNVTKTGNIGIDPVAALLPFIIALHDIGKDASSPGPVAASL